MKLPFSIEARISPAQRDEIAQVAATAIAQQLENFREMANEYLSKMTEDVLKHLNEQYEKCDKDINVRFKEQTKRFSEDLVPLLTAQVIDIFGELWDKKMEEYEEKKKYGLSEE